jgi:predicted nuclease of predicted toxin-antitoxin system
LKKPHSFSASNPMPKAFYKHKLLLDEHLFERRKYPLLNERFDVKHIRDDLHHGGMGDPDIYNLAVSLGRIILTTNVSDFRPLIREDSPGVIGIPDGWSANRIDTKLAALLIRHGANYFRGRFIPLAIMESHTEAA